MVDDTGAHIGAAETSTKFQAISFLLWIKLIIATLVVLGLGLAVKKWKPFIHRFWNPEVYEYLQLEKEVQPSQAPEDIRSVRVCKDELDSTSSDKPDLFDPNLDNLGQYLRQIKRWLTKERVPEEEWAISLKGYMPKGTSIFPDSNWSEACDQLWCFYKYDDASTGQTNSVSVTNGWETPMLTQFHSMIDRQAGDNPMEMSQFLAVMSNLVARLLKVGVLNVSLVFRSMNYCFGDELLAPFYKKFGLLRTLIDNETDTLENLFKQHKQQYNVDKLWGMLLQFLKTNDQIRLMIDKKRRDYSQLRVNSVQSHEARISPAELSEAHAPSQDVVRSQVQPPALKRPARSVGNCYYCGRTGHIMWKCNLWRLHERDRFVYHDRQLRCAAYDSDGEPLDLATSYAVDNEDWNKRYEAYLQ